MKKRSIAKAVKSEILTYLIFGKPRKALSGNKECSIIFIPGFLNLPSRKDECWNVNTRSRELVINSLKCDDINQILENEKIPLKCKVLKAGLKALNISHNDIKNITSPTELRSIILSKKAETVSFA